MMSEGRVERLTLALSQIPLHNPTEEPMQKIAFTVLTLSVLAGGAAAQKPAAPKTVPEPSGTYTTTVTKADLPADAPKQTADSVPGKWSLTFAAGKPVVVKHNGKEVVTAPAVFSAGKMSLDANDTGSLKCGIAAVYSYSEKNGRLVFKSDGEDTCVGRRVVLTKHPLKRAS